MWSTENDLWLPSPSCVNEPQKQFLLVCHKHARACEGGRHFLMHMHACNYNRHNTFTNAFSLAQSKLSIATGKKNPAESFLFQVLYALQYATHYKTKGHQNVSSWDINWSINNKTRTAGRMYCKCQGLSKNECVCQWIFLKWKLIIRWKEYFQQQ